MTAPAANPLRAVPTPATSTDVEVRTAPAGMVMHGGPSAAIARASLADRWRFAESLSQANLLPESYRGKPANVLLAIEKSEALGIHHMVGIESIHIIKGKSSLSAELMRALIQRAGHMFDLIEQTPEKAVIECARRERPDRVFRHEWTIAEARQAGLLSNDNWKKYPKAMVAARVTSEAARAHFSDVLAGMVYVPEELGAMVDESGEPVDITGTATVLPAAQPAVETDPAVAAELAERIEAADGPDALRALWTEVHAAQQNRQVIPAMGDALRDAIKNRGPVDEKTLQRLHIKLADRGAQDRDDKIAALRRITGRGDLDSSKHLTRGEALQVLAAIDATPLQVDIVTGETEPPGAGVVIDPDGNAIDEQAANEQAAADEWDGQA